MRFLLVLDAAVLLVCLVLTAVMHRSQTRLERLRAELAEYSGTFETDIPDTMGRDICPGEGGAFERTYVLIENGKTRDGGNGT
jgi:hypothetical protein